MQTSTEALEAQVQELRQKPFQELASMPAYQEKEEECAEGRVKIGIWVDSLGKGHLRVVVQAYKHWALGIGRMQADGFRMTAVGPVELNEGDLAEFC